MLKNEGYLFSINFFKGVPDCVELLYMSHLIRDLEVTTHLLLDLNLVKYQFDMKRVFCDSKMNGIYFVRLLFKTNLKE